MECFSFFLFCVIFSSSKPQAEKFRNRKKFFRAISFTSSAASRSAFKIDINFPKNITRDIWERHKKFSSAKHQNCLKVCFTTSQSCAVLEKAFFHPSMDAINLSSDSRRIRREEATSFSAIFLSPNRQQIVNHAVNAARIMSQALKETRDGRMCAWAINHESVRL